MRRNRKSKGDSFRRPNANDKQPLSVLRKTEVFGVQNLAEIRGVLTYAPAFRRVLNWNEARRCLTPSELAAMLDQYTHFGLGYSWGGFESLVAPAHIGNARTVHPWRGGPLVRYHIGLEDTDDLINDLEAGLARLTV